MFPVIELVEPNRDRGKFKAGSKLKQFRLARRGDIAQEGQGQMEGILIEQPPAATTDHPIGDTMQGASHPGGKPERKEKSRRPRAFGFSRHNPSSPSLHSVHRLPNSAFSGKMPTQGFLAPALLSWKYPNWNSHASSMALIPHSCRGMGAIFRVFPESPNT